MLEPLPPRVSLVMPARDAARFIGRSLESLITQTLRDIEIIVVDDGSTDTTAAIVQSCAVRDGRVRYARQEHGGISRALNHGIALARAEYIARLDSDDIALPDRLEKQAKFLDSAHEVGVVGGTMVTIDEHERKLSEMRYFTDRRKLRAALGETNPMGHSAIMMRRSVVLGAGGYRSAFDLAEDYDLWLRIAEQSDLANLADTVSYYRWHPAQSSSRGAARQVAVTLIAQAVARMRRRGAESTALHTCRARRPARASRHRSSLFVLDIARQIGEIIAAAGFAPGMALQRSGWRTRLPCFTAAKA